MNFTGLPVEVRDKFLAEEDRLQVPGSDANREYMTQVHEKQLAEGGSSYSNKPLNQKVHSPCFVYSFFLLFGLQKALLFTEASREFVLNLFLFFWVGMEYVTLRYEAVCVALSFAWCLSRARGAKVSKLKTKNDMYHPRYSAVDSFVSPSAI